MEAGTPGERLRVVLASRNAGKIAELRALLQGERVTVLGLGISRTSGKLPRRAKPFWKTPG